MLTAPAPLGTDLLDSGDLRPVALLAAEITGRRPSPGTVWRWCRRGTRAGTLPGVLLYGTWHTTAPALRAWMRAGTAAALAPRADADDATMRAAGLL